MQKLIVRLLLLSAPFLVFLALYQIQYERKRPNALAAKKALFESQKQNVEILVLGPSYSERAVIPDLLGRPAFNLAMPAQSIYYDHALLDKYLDKMPALKTVLLPVSYVTLASQLDTGPLPARCYFYRYEFGLPHRQWKMAWQARNYIAFYLDDRTRLDLLMGRCRDCTADYDPRGGCTAQTSDSQSSNSLAHLSASAASMLSVEKKSIKPEYLKENEQLLIDIIDDLQKRGVTPILFWPPVHRFYSQACDPNVYREERELLARICAKTGVGQHDFTNDRRFADTDFSDATHLTFPAAQRFSRILRGEVLAAMAQRTPAATATKFMAANPPDL